jgi:hypothetical protein
MLRMGRMLVAFVTALALASCTPTAVPAGPREFEQWLAADAARPEAFARFEALLQREGVAGVLEGRELWLTDRLAPKCVVEPFVMPPEVWWPRIVPALRYIRDYVEPAVGDVTVASGYRDEAFNACVRGATRSAHREYYALDLAPRDTRITREELIETLCPIHARDGARFDIGMGIYRARRFHIDAHGYRGWGEDFHRATFPCRFDEST